MNGQIHVTATLISGNESPVESQVGPAANLDASEKKNLLHLTEFDSLIA